MVLIGVVFDLGCRGRKAVAATASDTYRSRLTASVLIPAQPGSRPGRNLDGAFCLPGWLHTGARLLLGLLLSWCILVLVAQAIPPVATVYREWPSRACLAVVAADGAPVSCAQLPPIHEVVWVSASWNGPSPAAPHPGHGGVELQRRGLLFPPEAQEDLSICRLERTAAPLGW